MFGKIELTSFFGVIQNNGPVGEVRRPARKCFKPAPRQSGAARSLLFLGSQREQRTGTPAGSTLQFFAPVSLRSARCRTTARPDAAAGFRPSARDYQTPPRSSGRSTPDRPRPRCATSARRTFWLDPLSFPITSRNCQRSASVSRTISFFCMAHILVPTRSLVSAPSRNPCFKACLTTRWPVHPPAQHSTFITLRKAKALPAVRR
jgi:hypothetical protein